MDHCNAAIYVGIVLHEYCVVILRLLPTSIYVNYRKGTFMLGRLVFRFCKTTMSLPRELRKCNTRYLHNTCNILRYKKYNNNYHVLSDPYVSAI